MGTFEFLLTELVPLQLIQEKLLQNDAAAESREFVVVLVAGGAVDDYRIGDDVRIGILSDTHDQIGFASRSS